MKTQSKPGTVSDYIEGFAPKQQAILKKIRSTIKKAAPKAAERLSYGMPFYEYGGKGYQGRLIYFAAFKNHVSLFITPWQTNSVPGEMQKYHTSKATYQFPNNKPFPFSLLDKTVKAMVRERDSHSIKIDNKPSTPQSYHKNFSTSEKAICSLLFREIGKGTTQAENKIWHGHPVWFLDGNPVVGYSKQKRGIRLMFWSGADFEEELLNVRGEKYKDASIFYNNTSEINIKDLKRWLAKSEKIQWDYKNIVKRKGKLERLK